MSKLKLLSMSFINSLRVPLYPLQTTKMYSIEDKLEQPSPPWDKWNALLVDSSTFLHTLHAVLVWKHSQNTATKQLALRRLGFASSSSFTGSHAVHRRAHDGRVTVRSSSQGTAGEGAWPWSCWPSAQPRVHMWGSPTTLGRTPIMKG